MNQRLCLFVLFVPVWLMGCHSGGHRRLGPRDAGEGAPTCVTAEVVSFQRLGLGQECEINDVLLLPAVEGQGCQWHILVGPNPGGGAARMQYTNSEPDIFIENGWAYVVKEPKTGPSSAPSPQPGSPWGRARTKRVSGTAEGTRFIVQEQDGVHRVILLSGPLNKVRVVLDGQEHAAQNLTTAQTYFQVGPSDTGLPTPQSIVSPSSAVGQLAEYVESIAQLAGV